MEILGDGNYSGHNGNSGRRFLSDGNAGARAIILGDGNSGQLLFCAAISERWK